MSRFFVLLFSALCYLPLSAQTQFEAKVFTINNQYNNSGCAIGTADLNADGLADLILLDQTETLRVVYQSRLGQLKKVLNLGNVGKAWSLATGDVNNNGFMDIIVTSPQLGIQVFYADSTGMNYSKETLFNPIWLPQTVNLADINQDGWLDLYVCNDEGKNLTALNNGSGAFIENDSILPYDYTEEFDLSGNYGSIWSDYDRDGDVDLYVSKCRAGAEKGDPRRINMLFENTENGFVSRASELNLDSDEQSWAAAFIDVDNDLDLDLLVSHHFFGAELYINDGNQNYTEQSALRGLDIGETNVIQNLSADFDNDGDLDLLFVGSAVDYMENNGNGFFIKKDIDLGSFRIGSASIGDLNNDGFIDIYASFMAPYNNPTVLPDKIFYNKKNNNNFIEFQLTSELSNQNAVGASLEIHYGSKTQMRQILSGESFGVMCSNLIHFGIQQETKIDSLVVFWPDGNNETFESLDANNKYLIKENEYIYQRPKNNTKTENLYYCTTDSVELIPGNDSDSIRWENHLIQNNRWINSTGLYIAQQFINGGWINLAAYFIEEEKAYQPTINNDFGTTFCKDEMLKLIANIKDGDIINWNNNQGSSAVIDIIDPGTYHFTAENKCAIYSSDTVQIEFVETTIDSFRNDTARLGLTNILYAQGNGINWYADSTFNQLINQDSFLYVENVDATKKFYAVNEQIIQSPINQIGISAPNLLDDFHSDFINLGLRFDLYESLIISSFDVYTDTEGPRIFQIKDKTESIIYQDTFQLVSGKNTLQLNAALEQNTNYLLTTDTDFNFNNLGFSSPRLIRSDQVVYDFESNLIALHGWTSSNFNYYYFYNINYKRPDKICRSEPQIVYSVFDKNSSTKTVQINDFEYYPNPAKDVIHVYAETDKQLSFFNLKGQQLLSKKIKARQAQQINISALQSGLYIIEISGKAQTEYQKLIVD